MAKTYEPIATNTLGSDQASISFSSFAGYTDVILVASTRSTHSANGPITIRFNGDTGSNYSYTRLYGSGSAASSDRFTNASSIDFGFMPGTNSTSGIFGISTLHLQNYANTTTNKTSLVRWNTEGSVTAYTAAVVGLWRNTAAITSMSIAYTTGNILTGSTFTLYGIKAA
jgi:hypothetical protein